MKQNNISSRVCLSITERAVVRDSVLPEATKMTILISKAGSPDRPLRVAKVYIGLNCCVKSLIFDYKSEEEEDRPNEQTAKKTDPKHSMNPVRSMIFEHLHYDG